MLGENVTTATTLVEAELLRLASDVAEKLKDRDSAARLADELASRYEPQQVAHSGPDQRIWELTGLAYLQDGRVHDGLAIFRRLYGQMLDAQSTCGRVHKGMPLVWMSECYAALGMPTHAKRFMMLTLCEDAIRERGNISADGGSYFRLVWRHGLSDQDFHRYAGEFWKHFQRKADSLYPEALLQLVDSSWAVEVPTPHEAFTYHANTVYIRSLLDRLGSGDGHDLETLAEYLLSCIPGCRAKRRGKSGSTDYDVVCSLEGPALDFRAELGRYFVCECKDWSKPADFTTMAKFCRVLDSTKARFGILFSREGISGSGQTLFAEREQLKIFQDRGTVIVVLDRTDLESIAAGANLIVKLRDLYERVRLDLRSVTTPG